MSDNVEITSTILLNKYDLFNSLNNQFGIYFILGELLQCENYEHILSVLNELKEEFEN